MLIFWSLVRNSVVLAVYLLFSVACFLTVHEHYRRAYRSKRRPIAFENKAQCFRVRAHKTQHQKNRLACRKHGGVARRLDRVKASRYGIRHVFFRRSYLPPRPHDGRFCHAGRNHAGGRLYEPFRHAHLRLAPKPYNAKTELRMLCMRCVAFPRFGKDSSFEHFPII